MRNFVQPGSTVTVTASHDVLSGEGVLVGALFGVAAYDAKAGNPVEITTDGVFDLKAETGAGAAVSAGALVYWDAANKRVTDTAGANLIGVALLAKVDAGTTTRVRLNGAFFPA